MPRALVVCLVVFSAGCAATKGQLINGEPTLTSETSPTCADVVIRRAALGSRWGEFLRVRIDQTDAVIVGQLTLRAGARVEKQKAFFVSGKELVVESKWSNEKLDVSSALPKGTMLEVSLNDLTAAAGRCENVKFNVEHGALTPDIDEAQWLTQLGGAPKVALSSSRPATTVVTSPRKPAPKQKTASSESEWSTWAGRNADLDTSEWEPWPLASRLIAPTVGTPLAKGLWLAFSAQPASKQSVALALAAREKLKLETPRDMSVLVDRLRPTVKTDDAAALMLFVGPLAVDQAVRRTRADASFEELSRALLPHERAQLDGAALALTMSTAFALGWPVPDLTEVTSPYGMRTHPILGGERMHGGIDLSVPEGTPIIATGPGIVIRAGETKVNGKYVVIDHGHGVTSAYLHNSKLLVTEGQRVATGDFLSLSGNTGRSTGPHLHYQLEISQQTVDPLYFRPQPLLRAGR
ncbi:MAG: M23 family metallopeptidase [Archangium sp.]|nr:M23 family metallopeptidase [Archangium sp.]